jgi:hypothetical protein
MSDTLRDDAIVRLRERVRMAPYAPLPAAPNDRPARVRITLQDRRTLVRECLSAQGGADRPFPPQVFVDKIARLTGDVYPRFVATYQELAHAEARDLAARWRVIVERMCAPVASGYTQALRA